MNLSLLSEYTPDFIRQRIAELPFVQDMKWILRNARKNRFRPKSIFDVGAYEGEWSALVRSVFPDSEIVLIEPQRDVRSVLEQKCRDDPTKRFIPKLLGATNGEKVAFHEQGSVSTVLSGEGVDQSDVYKLQTVTLDRLIEEYTIPPPDFLKLDVQGYELEVLRGGKNLLLENPPEMILMEVSLIDCIGGAPLLPDVCSFMDERGYRPYDLCTFYRRPLDDALWQIDMFFVHTSSSLVASSAYR